MGTENIESVESEDIIAEEVETEVETEATEESEPVTEAGDLSVDKWKALSRKNEKAKKEAQEQLDAKTQALAEAEAALQKLTETYDSVSAELTQIKAEEELNTFLSVQELPASLASTFTKLPKEEWETVATNIKTIATPPKIVVQNSQQGEQSEVILQSSDDLASFFKDILKNK